MRTWTEALRLPRCRTGLAAPPAPMGIKLTWFLSDPIAILNLVGGVALLPDKRGRAGS